ncbi:MAG TPA: Ku protein, partial [Kofleriaceae bacterium]|nr:Ku protein [Kofleriaceae bacterium]
MPARAIGTATISFGLVSIPVKLYTTAESSGDISFNMLHDACGSRLKQQYVCTKDGEIVDREHTVKGYQFAKDQYVVLSNEELKALDAVATHQVDLAEFVPASAVDPLFLDKAYYLGPEKGGERAYHLLAEAMIATQLVGVASYAARGKSYIVLVRPYENGLCMHQLRYADELKQWNEVPMPDLPDVKSSELELAKQIIQQIATDAFTPQKYKDEVKARMLQLIEKKIEGQEITAAPEVPQGKIIDLMEALKASLGMPKQGERMPAAAAAPAAAPVEEEAAPKKK